MPKKELVPAVALKRYWPKSKQQAEAVSKAYDKALGEYRSAANDARPCFYCGQASKNNLLMDEDGRLDRAQGQKWRVVCPACLSYTRIGQNPVKGLSAFEDGFLGKWTRLIHVDPKSGPDAQTMNALFKAIGVAMSFKSTKTDAQKVYDQLSGTDIVELTKRVYGSNMPSDLGEALAELAKEPHRYADRGEAMAGARLLFHPKVLQSWGAKLTQEMSTREAASPDSWAQELKPKLDRIKRFVRGEDIDGESFSMQATTAAGIPQSIDEIDLYADED